MLSTTVDEFWGVPIPVWNLGATLLLAFLTGAYVVLTWRVVRNARTAASAALASVEVDLKAALYSVPEAERAIVQVTNRGANLHIHAATIRDFYGNGQLRGQSVEWEDRTLPADLVPVDSWGPLPWHVHKGEHRTFYWPLEQAEPVPPVAFVTISLIYSVGARGEHSSVYVPLSLDNIEPRSAETGEEGES